MSRSRRMPPLFEVMRETNPVRTPMNPVPVVTPPPASAPVPKPVIRAIPTPAPEAAPPLTLRTHTPAAAPETDEPGPAPRSGGGQGWDLNRTVVLPFKTLLFAAGGVMTLLVVVWVVGWRLGAQAERRDWAPEPDPTQVTPSAALPTRDPLSAGAERPTSPRQNQPAGTPAGASRQPQAPATKTQAPPPAPGQVTDPRGTGLNYLWVETVTKLADADGIVAFLGANGLPAVAVPKGKADIATARAKNARDWEVVLLEGIPGNQYSAKAARREELIRQVKALGQQLAREGLSDFHLSSPSWKKY